MNGSLISFMDRVFFSASRQEHHPFMLKPAAAIVSARRAGTTSALNQMNKYFLYGQMLIISSRYWNMVHGNNLDEVMQDAEGLQIMRVLARNMAWFLKLKETGKSRHTYAYAGRNTNSKKFHKIINRYCTFLENRL